MRIGFDAKRAFHNFSGLGNYSRDIIRSLHEQFPEHEYILYTPRLNNDLTLIEGDHIQIKSPRAPLGKIQQSWWRTYGLAGEIEKDRLDIFHGLSNELPRHLEKRSLKKMVTIHDLIFLRYPGWYPYIDRTIYNRKFRYAARIADKVITVSEQTKQDLQEFFGTEDEKIRVIYQGCHQKFTITLDEKQKKEAKIHWNLPDEYLLYVGRIEKRKNLLNLVIALHQQAINMPLVVVGRSTPYAKKVREYIQAKQMKNILFLEEVQVEDLPALYQMAKIFLYPSVFEGFGIPILEALHSGVPVITSRGGCFSEVGGAAALYVDPEDPEEIGVVLKDLLNDPERQQQLISRGRQQARTFSNDKIAFQIMELYKGISHA